MLTEGYDITTNQAGPPIVGDREVWRGVLDVTRPDHDRYQVFGLRLIPRGLEEDAARTHWLRAGRWYALTVTDGAVTVQGLGILRDRDDRPPVVLPTVQGSDAILVPGRFRLDPTADDDWNIVQLYGGLS